MCVDSHRHQCAHRAAYTRLQVFRMTPSRYHHNVLPSRCAGFVYFLVFNTIKLYSTQFSPSSSLLPLKGKHTVFNSYFIYRAHDDERIEFLSQLNLSQMQSNRMAFHDCCSTNKLRRTSRSLYDFPPESIFVDLPPSLLFKPSFHASTQ